MMHRAIALTFGLVCHLSFLGAVGIMAAWLYGGMDLGPLRLQSRSSLVVDLLLLLQFPLIHSFLLGGKGRRALERVLPGELGKRMISTSFVVAASLQLIALFIFWAPLGGFRWEPSGVVRAAWVAVYVCSWIFLAVAMWNAGLSTQMGYLGWLSVWRGQEPRYGDFPTSGLYKLCRHPVYFAMALVAITGPIWTLDHVIVAVVFCAYCVVGPLRKDARYRLRFGERFEQYKRATPFFPMPSLKRKARR